MSYCNQRVEEHQPQYYICPQYPICTPILPPRKLIRNGMDYQPTREERACNPPHVRSWQMSPFGRERFDLNEVQQAEKMGFKFRYEAQRLRELYFGSSCKPTLVEFIVREPCMPCLERRLKEEHQKRRNRFKSNPMYKPYGPPSCRKYPDKNPNKVLGPSVFTCYQYKGYENCPPKIFVKAYSPYGPV